MVDKKVQASAISIKLLRRRLGLAQIMPPMNNIENLYYTALIRTWSAMDMFAVEMKQNYKTRIHHFIAHELQTLIHEIKESILLEPEPLEKTL